MFWQLQSNKVVDLLVDLLPNLVLLLLTPTNSHKTRNHIATGRQKQKCLDCVSVKKIKINKIPENSFTIEFTLLRYLYKSLRFSNNKVATVAVL